jgi:ribonuclease VapC
LIVVDTSALMAILLQEPGSESFIVALSNTTRAIMGSPTRFELDMVATGRLKADGIALARQLVEAQQVEVIDWDAALSDIATLAFLQFGKGRHPAQLNFGDCMAYALAKSLDAPLLYKGGDFAKTDIRSAL